MLPTSLMVSALALQALRDGWTEIVFAGPAETCKKVESAAETTEARVHASAPVAVDLLTAADIDAACHQALGEDRV